jgi:hypothetical protein
MKADHQDGAGDGVPRLTELVVTIHQLEYLRETNSLPDD